MSDVDHVQRVSAFKARLVAASSPMEIVREMITHGSAAKIDDERYTTLRMRTASTLGISANRDVFLVGSAKLGFSIKPARRFEPFGDESDVDLALVAPSLYERLWKETRRFIREGGEWEGRKQFRNDHVHGVIKPYVLPEANTVATKRQLFDLGASLQRSGISAYPITLAVWHSIEALEDYQAMAVRQCMDELEL